ncbi:AMIN domain-containing protein [Scytonema millei]|nr:AMIN domain-containing protein [Scytonema millei]
MKALCSCLLGFQLLNLRVLATTLVLLVAPPALAEAVNVVESRDDYPPASLSLQGGALMAQQTSSQVTAVQLQQTDKGLEVILETPDGKSLQVFPSSFGKTFVANIPNAQLAEGKTFRQENPSSGIASIAVTQQGTNSIRVTVTGTRDLPKVDVGRGDAAGFANALLP